MTPREIIAEAWHITIKHKHILLRWGVADAFIIMIWAMAFVMYQTYVLGVFFRTGEIASWREPLAPLFALLQSSPIIGIFLVVLLIVLFLLWIVLPRMATGALIGLAAKIHCGDEPKGGLVLGVYNFFPLLELAAAVVLIDGKALFSLWSMFVRYMGGTDVMFATSSILLLLWVTSFLFNFLFTFAEEAIVIRKVGVFRALGQSFKLVLSYLSKVILIAILLLIITLRIIVNALIIFLIPSIVMGLGLLLATFLPEIVSFGISGTIGLVGILFASYFLGYVTVFKHTVWTITYLELSKERELDVIVPASVEDEVQVEKVVEGNEEVTSS